MPKPNAYAKTDDVQQSRDDRMARLKVELREHIRFLNDHPIMADNWLRMAESLHQIANVAFMELHLPAADDNPLAQTGKKETGTLWDQEKDELAIRILLEEGKLNLALRLLNKYKHVQRSPAFGDLVTATCKKFNSDPAAVLGRCRVFEQSVGVLLKFALHHVEALQILDVPQLVTHVREVLTDALASTKTEVGPDAEKLQETLVLHYLASLAAKMEDMDEDAVMDTLDKEGILPLAIRHLHAHFAWYRIDTLAACARFLSQCIGSEAYTTDPKRFIGTPELQQTCVALKGLFVAELVSTYGLKRKDVQHLLDQLEKWEAVHGPAKLVPLKPHASAKSSSAAASATDAKSAAAPATTAANTTATATATATPAKPAAPATTTTTTTAAAPVAGAAKLVEAAAAAAKK